jgi:hypothetical protein
MGCPYRIGEETAQEDRLHTDTYAEGLAGFRRDLTAGGEVTAKAHFRGRRKATEVEDAGR